jgi:hypothetical protein
LRYDPLGRRVEIADSSAVTRYAYDRQAIAAEYDSTNTLAAHWINAGPLDACPLEMVRDGQRYFYLVDGQRSTAALADMSGAVVASYRYQAFGSPLRIGTIENPFEHLCIYVYGRPGLGFPAAGPYDPQSGQSLNDTPTELPSPNPFRGGNPMTPPGGNDPGGQGGSLGGEAEEPTANRCVVGDTPQIYPKGWKGLAKGANKLMRYPRRDHPKKGAGTEYVGLLPTQDTVQSVADYGFVLRCQIGVAADALAQ